MAKQIEIGKHQTRPLWETKAKLCPCGIYRLKPHEAAADDMVSALEAIIKEAGIRHFDGEPTGTIQTIAYLANAALAKAKS